MSIIFFDILDWIESSDVPASSKLVFVKREVCGEREGEGTTFTVWFTQTSRGL